MGAGTSLAEYMLEWAGDDAVRKPVADTLKGIAAAASVMAEHVAISRQAQTADADSDGAHGASTLMRLDVLADELFQQSLKDAPVAYAASATCDGTLQFNADAPVAVTVHALDSIANLEVEAPAGTLFSVYAAAGDSAGDATIVFRPGGREQLAAGFVLYGQHTTLVFSTGNGVLMFVLDRDTAAFLLRRRDVRIPTGTKVSADRPLWNVDHNLHAANDMRDLIARHDRCRDSARRADSLAAETYRVLIRGGVFLSPRDGSLPQLVFEANPVALLVEQAGGMATDGKRRILDIVPRELHQQLPVVFGAAVEVERLLCIQNSPSALTSRSPLFRDRNLFRSS
jgi:fructose-1,6-bisphosphatase I